MIKQDIIPAIIPDTYAMLERRLEQLRGLVRVAQVDVMDGTYTATSSWPYVGVDRETFLETRSSENGLPYWQAFELEVDLMVREPEQHIGRWVLAGASRIIVHVESTEKLQEIVAQCVSERVELALAVRPSTDPKVLEPYIDDIVFVQCMGNDRIGFHGVSLDPRAVAMLRTLHDRWPELLLGVDIGVNKETIAELYEAGARRFAAGSAVFGAGDPSYALRTLAACLPQ